MCNLSWRKRGNYSIHIMKLAFPWFQTWKEYFVNKKEITYQFQLWTQMKIILKILARYEKSNNVRPTWVYSSNDNWFNTRKLANVILHDLYQQKIKLWWKEKCFALQFCFRSLSPNFKTWANLYTWNVVPKEAVWSCLHRYSQ